MPATVDHTAYARQVTDFKTLHLITHGRDSADNLVTRHGRIKGVFPLITRRMQVGMADTAIKDLDLHIFGTGFTTLNFKGRQRTRGTLCRVGFALDHIDTLLLKMAESPCQRAPIISKDGQVNCGTYFAFGTDRKT
jgi:hypothetical protein